MTSSQRQISSLARKTLPAIAFFAILLLILRQPQVRYVAQTRLSTQSSRVGRGRDTSTDVANRTLGFEKIFVISMPGRADKLDLWALASLYSDIDVEIVNGVRGDEMPTKAIPAGWDAQKYSSNTLGCLRGHLNAVQRVVDQRLTSALILEDDADWDIMLKSQLAEFAKGTRYIQDVNESRESLSPYGDGFDMLWLGNCGTKNRPEDDGRYYIVADDPTVAPVSQHTADLLNRKPDMSAPGMEGNFTRIVYNNRHGMCAYAYGLSLSGATKLLYEFSTRPHPPPIDKALSRFCANHLSNSTCLTTFPPLFQPHDAVGDLSKNSDRVDLTAGAGKASFRWTGFTGNVVFPVKSRLGNFVTRNNLFRSQWPAESLLPEIDRSSFEMPRGKGVFLRSEEFHPPPTY